MSLGVMLHERTLWGKALLTTSKNWSGLGILYHDKKQMLKMSWRVQDGDINHSFFVIKPQWLCNILSALTVHLFGLQVVRKFSATIKLIVIPKIFQYLAQEIVGGKLAAHFQTKLVLAPSSPSHTQVEDTQARNTVEEKKTVQTYVK